MKRFKNILVATDTRLERHPIVDDAIELAQRNDAALTIVDVAPKPSWIAKQVTDDLEHLYELNRKEKSEKLESLALLARESRVDAETKLLSGKTSVEIVRQVLRGEHDLVVAITKGTNSKSTNAYGRTARRLLQTCPSAVWLVTPNARSKPKNVAACLDIAHDDATNRELNDKVYENSLSLADLYDCNLSVLHAWKLEDEAILHARMNQTQVDACRERHLSYRKKLMENFLKSHDANVGNTHFLNGDVAEVIPAFVLEQDVDMVVMGTVARSGLSGFFIGNTADRMLDRLTCSILALKPYRYRTPIRADS